MAEKEKSVLESLDELKDFDGDESGEPKVAKVKARKKGKVKEQRWMSDDKADSLLSELIGQTEADAEAERRRREDERRRKEEEERRSREQEELQRKAETEQRLAAERARLQEQEVRRTQMLAAIERKRKIDSGELKEEEERRQKEEEERRKAAEEAARLEKEQALSDAQRLIQQQQQALVEMKNREAEAPFVAPRSNVGLVIGIAVAVVLIGGGAAAAYILLQKPEAEAVDPYAMEQGFPITQLAVSEPSSALTEVGLDVVSQSKDQQVVTIAAGGGSAAEDTSSGRRSRRRGSSSTRRARKSEFDNLGKGGGVLKGKGGGIVF